MKQISAMPALLTITVSISLASAQSRFMIYSVNSGQVLDVPGFSTTPGTLIQQWPPNLGKNQQWTFREVSLPHNGFYEIVSVNSGQVLDVPGFSTTPGTQIQQWPANGGTNQQWTFSRAPGSTGYEIVSRDEEYVACSPDPCFPTYVNLVLDVPGFSTHAGTVIQQWTENDGTNQQWNLHSLTSEKISLGSGGSVLEVTGFGFPPGTLACPVLLVPFSATPCATVLANGTFSATISPPGFYYSNSVRGYVVVTIEDNAGNVLAIGSTPGGFEAIIQ
jgi:hypothetical protein